MFAEPGVYGWSGGQGGTHFHRMEEPLRVAKLHGIKTATGVNMDDSIAEQFDTVLVYQLSNERASEGWEKLARNGQHRLIFDIDDAMWQPDWEPFQNYYTTEVVERMWRNASMAHVVTTPSPIIAEYMSHINRNVWLVPYTMPEWVRDLGRARLEDRRNIVGFAGSASHDKDISTGFLKDLQRFMHDFPTWKLHFWGKERHEVTGWPPGRTKCYPWTDTRLKYYTSLRMEVGIAPLRPTLFNRCKSALRFIENASRGICTVVQDLEPYKGYVRDQENGIAFGPDNRWSNWYNTLAWLALHPDERRTMGARAWNDSAAWTTEANILRWTEAWNSV